MNYVDYVNVKQGTANHFTFSNGNILPITGMPFGMSSFSLETNGIGTEGWYYSPSSMLTTGIRLTHQPSPWVGDYGEIAFMTTSGDRVYFDHNRRSGYRPSETVMNPYYMNVRFMQYRSTLDLDRPFAVQWVTEHGITPDVPSVSLYAMSAEWKRA